MIDNKQIEQIIREVVSEVVTSKTQPASPSIPRNTLNVSGDSIPDLSAIDFRTVMDVPNAADAEEFLRIKAKTSARLGVWRAGPRYRTNTMLRFKADHAAAMDAVFTELSQATLDKAGLFTVTTLCATKDDHLTRPDLGRQFSPETIAEIKSKCKHNPQVQIIVSDGLSNTAIEANICDLLPALVQGLKGHGIDVGTPFFIKHGRVGAMDPITEALGAEVTVMLLGERPGLASGESLSAYMTYKGFVGMPEASRNVISNIYRGGTNPVEAGAHIADVVKLMLAQKASGLNLKL
ncbi:MAG: ethanolamine ammonia-lyase subunit EutC [Synergistaceae bacterium]|nr:ethanolamine ammonia-lyase subunit EutC [Synergistaceae bacterium]